MPDLSVKQTSVQDSKFKFLFSKECTMDCSSLQSYVSKHINMFGSLADELMHQFTNVNFFKNVLVGFHQCQMGEVLLFQCAAQPGFQNVKERECSLGASY